MDILVKTVLAELPTTVTTTHLLECVPRFLQEAQKLAIPGAEKKAAVLAALHQLVDTLNHENTKEFNAFIDETIAPTIDLMVSAYNGTLRAPTTVEEVTKQVNCFLQSIQAVVGLIKKCKLAKKGVVAEVVADVPKTEVAEVVADVPKTEVAETA
jgi:hypothetical protein